MDPAYRGVDEDEGSPLRNGVNDLFLLLLGEGRGKVKKSNDQRKPSGYAIPVTSFPPKDNSAPNTCG